MPVRNEAEHIGATLDACLAQNYNGAVDIIVADAMSHDGTREIVATYGRSDGVRMVDNPSLTTPAGLNAAIAATNGDIIVRCDARSELPVDYVTTAVAVLAETGAANVGGVQRAVGISPVQRAIAAAMSSPFGVGDARFHMGGKAGVVDTVYLGVFRREALEAVGGFDETLLRNQDYELNYRLRQNGGDIYFDPSLEVIYRPRPSLRRLAKQYFEYGRWKRVVVKRHPGSLRWRQLVAPAFVLGVTVSVAVSIAGYPLISALVPGTYALANVGATVIEIAKRRDVAMFLLPAAFITMHLAWGVGFLLPAPHAPSDA